MRDFEQEDYKIFEMFSNKWALVTAGDINGFNSCTIGWGSLGNIWSRNGKRGAIITVYVYPSRYTCDFLRENKYFTVSFFPDSCRKALAYMGSHSGRDEDKVRSAGLTPKAMGNSVTFEEAELTFYCKKLYQHPFEKSELDEDIRDYYRSSPASFPLDEKGEWQTHWEFVGEILEADDNTDPSLKS